MFGVQQMFEYGKSKIKLSIVFEVVDDPDDSSEFRNYLKPVDVWFRFSRESRDLPLDPDSYRKADAKTVMYFPGLTKQTGRDLRQWGSLDTERDRSYLYVLAEPTKEWKRLYDSRQYKLQVDIGRAYNIAVSLPRLPVVQSGHRDDATAKRPNVKPDRFDL